ncbi:MAG: dual specificity protein phosphatase family protein [Thaumarchaeota archaeon]|nr:dual specificity protein phosphatase family protein [Nitrososphaerota archaeon]
MGTGGVFLRKLRAKVTDQPTGFVWIEKCRLAGSGYPASRSQVEWIADQGIGVILTLTEDALPAAWAQGLSIVTHHIPMNDHAAPGAAALDAAVSFIRGQLEQGESVLVHCLAGEGRTGCVLAAYLIKEKKVGADEAMRTLREVKPEFVERSQEDAVRNYASTVKP